MDSWTSDASLAEALRKARASLLQRALGRGGLDDEARSVLRRLSEGRDGVERSDGAARDSDENGESSG